MEKSIHKDKQEWFFQIYSRVGRNPYEVCLHSSLKLPGGDTLLDVHPTLLKVLCKGCIPPQLVLS